MFVLTYCSFVPSSLGVGCSSSATHSEIPPLIADPRSMMTDNWRGYGSSTLWLNVRRLLSFPTRILPFDRLVQCTVSERPEQCDCERNCSSFNWYGHTGKLWWPLAHAETRLSLNIDGTSISYCLKALHKVRSLGWTTPRHHFYLLSFLHSDPNEKN